MKIVQIFRQWSSRLHSFYRCGQNGTQRPSEPLEGTERREDIKQPKNKLRALEGQKQRSETAVVWSDIPPEYPPLLQQYGREEKP